MDTLETVFSKHKPSDLNELALNLTAQASVKHSKGDFKVHNAFAQLDDLAAP